MPDASLIVAYGTVVNVGGDVRIDAKYCRQGFNVEARKMGGHGAYLLDFDTDPTARARHPRHRAQHLGQ
jgi:predicted transposase YbfD/YdcC